MKRIRCGMGLGDALYLQGAVRHLVEHGQRLEVCSNWPDVFRPLGDKVRVVPFTRDRVDIVAHYVMRKPRDDTTQFQDVCLAAGIREPVDFRLDWRPVNHQLIELVRNSAKPVVLVQLPRAPMNRTDGFGAEILPDCSVIQRVIHAIGGKAFKVQVGGGKALFRFSGIDLDLAGKTSVSDLLDLGWAADAFLGYCSFMVPLAESFAKPALFVWSRRGLKSRHAYIRQITPGKILHRETSRHIFDDCKEPEVAAAASALCDAGGRGGQVQGKDGGHRRQRAGVAA